jgi:hypothetical protein
MTVLAPLQVIGIGSCNVESLESYGARIAYVHSVNPLKVFSLARRASECMGNAKQGRGLSYQRVCGYGDKTNHLISGLERLTGRSDLRCATLSAFNGVLASNITGVFSNNRRWCPLCYLKPQADRYDLLAWQLVSVTHCPLDGARLVDRCRKCAAIQPDFQSIDGPRYVCRICSCSLGWIPAAEQAETLYERWSNLHSKEFIEYASAGFRPIEGNPWAVFIARLEPESVTAPSLSLLRAAIASKVARYNCRPRIGVLFSFAAQQSVSPLQVLLDPVGASSPTLGIDQVGVFEDSERRVRLDRLGRNQKHLQYVATVLAKANIGLPLPPDKWIAECFGVWPGEWEKSNGAGRSEYEAVRKILWPERPTGPERTMFIRALDAIQRWLDEGGAISVAEAVSRLAAEFPAKKRKDVPRVVLSSLALIYLFRRLRPNERLHFSSGRPITGGKN